MNDSVGDGGFEKAFDALFPRAARLAHRILGEQAAAEDVAAEALARTYARWRKVGSLSYLDAWVLRVTANLAIDASRRRVPEQRADAPLNMEEAAVLRHALGHALRSLPPRQREAVALRYLSDLTEAEVADAMGLSAGTVHTHVRRGLVALRVRLGYDLEGTEDAVDLA